LPGAKVEHCLGIFPLEIAGDASRLIKRVKLVTPRVRGPDGRDPFAKIRVFPECRLQCISRRSFLLLYGLRH
jgi:hypothetical protein